MKKFLAILLASSAIVSCKPVDDPNAIESADSETGRINAWFDTKFEEELDFSPIRKTFLGIKTDYDKIDDYSVEALDKQLEWRRESVEEMKSTFDYDELSDEAKISWDMWLFRLEQAEANAKFRDNGYVLHQFNGQQSFFPTFLINQHKVENEEDMKAYIARLNGSARVGAIAGAGESERKFRHTAAAFRL